MQEEDMVNLEELMLREEDGIDGEVTVMIKTREKMMKWRF